MQGNVHKSDAGWRRLNARIQAGEGVHSRQMDFSPEKAEIPKYRKSRKSVAETDVASKVTHQPRMRNRRRVVIDTR